MATIARRPHVLIAEHDEHQRRALAWALRGDGYRVTEVRDGGELLEHLGAALLRERAWVDLLIVDAQMPVFTGYTAVAALQSLNWTTPVVIVEEPDAEAQGSKASNTMVFRKPLPVDKLCRAIRQLMIAPAAATAAQPAPRRSMRPRAAKISSAVASSSAVSSAR